MRRSPTQAPALYGVSARGSRRLAFAFALGLAFASAALAVTWTLRLIANPQPVPADAHLIGALPADEAAQQAARLFGAEPLSAASGPAAPSRFRLYGVIAGGDRGAALIGTDGAPPRAVRVGQPVAPGVVLRATGYRMVWLERDGVRQQLNMEPPSAQPAPAAAYTPTMPQFTPAAVAPPALAPTVPAAPREDRPD
ncbi:type II secretion system protein N [Thiomonas sp.]|uniref:type II secretion system protein N n=1 Tax=Thiomonas sp. TaxID=2047785 RepID=UPI00261202B3|nr:type II secretion system protein N [Thiomonas sp.]